MFYDNSWFWAIEPHLDCPPKDRLKIKLPKKGCAKEFVRLSLFVDGDDESDDESDDEVYVNVTLKTEKEFSEYEDREFPIPDFVSLRLPWVKEYFRRRYPDAQELVEVLVRTFNMVLSLEFYYGTYGTDGTPACTRPEFSDAKWSLRSFFMGKTPSLREMDEEIRAEIAELEEEAMMLGSYYEWSTDIVSTMFTGYDEATMMITGDDFPISATKMEFDDMLSLMRMYDEHVRKGRELDEVFDEVLRNKAADH